ncbi:PREDICTED: uncharacterized protein LOC108367033 isoform X2 [Rhagoletis zephyria]|uniref:uncharacterized protein LOC108367033 isoform X2 n=2 Tax=Rhagoletis zephyria TaxID=28612 RepID=UPI00081172F5|nr:PREDICTED: uncharacterized protein LOC108367033 isoform X2 [Rhagoletis zephyria]
MSDDESAHIQPVVLGLTNDQRCLKEFIIQLESMPELWDPSSKSYMNKIKRTAGHEKLLLILKKINDNATVGDVRKKINSLRSNYRKELKKIIDSKRSGAGTEDVYIPKSWTFNALHFLNKNEKPVDLTINYKHSIIMMIARTTAIPAVFPLGKCVLVVTKGGLPNRPGIRLLFQNKTPQRLLW